MWGLLFVCVDCSLARPVPTIPARTPPAPAGQEGDARDLHSNYTAAWRAFGWLPELFGFDLGGISSADGGYNLRPEHVESTFMLHAVTQDPAYITVAASMLEALKHCRVACGYTRIANVETGEWVWGSGLWVVFCSLVLALPPRGSTAWSVVTRLIIKPNPNSNPSLQALCLT